MRCACAILPIFPLLAALGCESEKALPIESGERVSNGTEAAAPSDHKAPTPPHSDAQTFAQAIQIMCDAPTEVDVSKVVAAERAQMLAKHIESKVTHKRARFAFEALGALAPSERYERMKKYAAEAQVEHCKLTDELAKGSQPTEEPAAAATTVASVASTPADRPSSGTDTGALATPTGTAASAGEEAEATIPLEAHYLGKHRLRVNRVGHGSSRGKGKIVREANALVLQASIKAGEHSLDISGVVRPISKTEFVLDGQFSGVPDLSWRQVPPTNQSTRGSFTFRATQGRKFWRLYEVDGKECVCQDNCGNDFCYIDLFF